MKELWKYIGPSFFSDKIARQAPSRGVGSILIAALFAVLFLALGIVAAYALPLKTNISNTPELKATVERALCADGAAIEIADGKLRSDRLIDTVKNDGDRQDLSRGYDIVVDTRPVGTFDDFTAYCTTKSGKEISYEEYLGLGEDEKTLYTFAIRYSGKERVIDDEWVKKCEDYLDGVTSEDAASAYAEVKKKSGDEYKTALYDLYVRTYYPSLTSYESDGNAPKTRNFYYHDHFRREKIIFFFCDSVIGSFVTDFGAKNPFYGYYGKLSDGPVGTSGEDALNFLYGCVDGASAVTVYSAVIGFFSVAPFIALIVVAAIVALFCFNKILKLSELKFGAAAKTVCSFLTVASIFAALVAFALGYFLSQSLLAWLEGVALFAILAIRIAVFLIRSRIEEKRASEGESDNENAACVA